jgi:hypothetical protein
MKYRLVIFAFFSFFSIVFGQEGSKMKKFSSQTTSFSIIKGDTLHVGYFEKNVFSSKKQYQNIFIKDKKNVCGFSECKTDLSDSLLVVKNIIQYTENCVFSFQNSTVIEVATLHTNYYIAIEKALQAREVILFPNTYIPKKAHELTGEAVLFLNLNFLNAKNEDFAMRYIRLANSEKAKLYDQNPTLFNNEKNSWLEEMDAFRKQITVKDTFFMSVPVYIGKYAVDKNQFLIVDNEDGYGTKPLKYFEDTKVQFDNFSSVWTLNSSRSKAEFFLNATLPDYNGSRKAYVQVKAICTSVERNPKAGAFSVETQMNTILHFRVLEINAVDSQHLQYNQIGYSRAIN